MFVRPHRQIYFLPAASTACHIYVFAIISGNHDRKGETSNLPAITGMAPKRPKKQSFGEAASTFASAIRAPEIRRLGVPLLRSVRTNCLSPGRVTELMSKKLQELKELQYLEHNILTNEEFGEQKALVLASLRKLIH